MEDALKTSPRERRYRYILSTVPWASKSSSGLPPPGLYGAACASAGHLFYVYGGNDGTRFHKSLHQQDTKTLVWTELSRGPMRKDASEMVVYGDKLVSFGGIGELGSIGIISYTPLT